MESGLAESLIDGQLERDHSSHEGSDNSFKTDKDIDQTYSDIYPYIIHREN